MFQIKFSRDSEKFLNKCDKILIKRIFNKLKKLKENPFPSDCKKVEGQIGKVFRIRMGNYRILYEVFKGIKMINIINIDKRSKIYKK